MTGTASPLQTEDLVKLEAGLAKTIATLLHVLAHPTWRHCYMYWPIQQVGAMPQDFDPVITPTPSPSHQDMLRAGVAIVIGLVQPNQNLPHERVCSDDTP
jgi:hypothetical protein